MRRKVALSALTSVMFGMAELCTSGTGAAQAEIPNGVLRVGVLNDMAGPYSDGTGAGSVVAARLAAEDFMKETKDIRVEILSADHQNKPDVGAQIARRWVDREGVDAIVDLPNSAVAFAVSYILHEKQRVALASSAGSSDLTGKSCSSTTVQWVTDTWAQAHGTANALLDQDKKTWFFLTVDYALGRALERDAGAVVAARGGKVMGAVRHPLDTPDFSSLLLQAQASGAQVLGLASTGMDAVNAVKQANEFGISAKAQIAGLFVDITQVESVGLATMKGIVITDAFYWDLNDKTRDFAKRFGAKMMGRMPNSAHAGVYSATLAYLRAARDARSVDGETVVGQMRREPIEDSLFGTVKIRPDGRATHAMYLFRVKNPDKSRAAWDDYQLLRTIPGDQAFRPLADGGCPLAK